MSGIPPSRTPKVVHLTATKKGGTEVDVAAVLRAQLPHTTVNISGSASAAAGRPVSTSSIDVVEARSGEVVIDAPGYLRRVIGKTLRARGWDVTG